MVEEVQLHQQIVFCGELPSSTSNDNWQIIPNSRPLSSWQVVSRGTQSGCHPGARHTARPCSLSASAWLPQIGIRAAELPPLPGSADPGNDSRFLGERQSKMMHVGKWHSSDSRSGSFELRLGHLRLLNIRGNYRKGAECTRLFL